MQKAAIFDLDGTLVDVSSIRHFVEGEKRNFDLFHENSKNCPPHKNVLAFVNELRHIGFKIIIFSGRISKYQELSEKWLRKNLVEYDLLRLREINDFRSDVIIKREFFRQLSDFEVIIAIDDRKELRTLWTALGVNLVLDPEDFSIESALAKLNF